MAQMVDMAGKKVGKWNVLHRLPTVETGRKAVVWKCRCDCGEERNILGVNLRKGCTTSCGCNIVKPEKFIGTMVGSLKIIKQVPMPDDVMDINFMTCTYWQCQCECGNMIILPRPFLVNGASNSRWHCGCLDSFKPNYKFAKIQYALRIVEKRKEEVLQLASEGYGPIKIYKKTGINPFFVKKFLFYNWARDKKNGGKKT